MKKTNRKKLKVTPSITLKELVSIRDEIKSFVEKSPVFMAMDTKPGQAIDDVVDYLKRQEDYFRAQSNQISQQHSGDQMGFNSEFSYCVCRRMKGVPMQEVLFITPAAASQFIINFANQLGQFRQIVESLLEKDPNFPLGTY